MSTSTLTDRYVYATTRAVPEPQRDELARELRAEIADMVAARADAGEPGTDAERATLTELGDPERLAASYADRPLHLIGPAYFLIWKRLVITLLLWVPPILAIITAGGELLDGEDLGKAIGDGISTGIEVAVHVALWTTLTFALIERYGKPTDMPEWSVDQLPEIPAESHVGLGDTVGTVATAVVTIALLAWQELRGVIETSSGTRVPLVDSDLWSSWLPVLIAAMAAEAVIAVLAYRRGRWTWPLVGAFSVASLAFTVPAIWLLVTDAFFDPRFVAEVDWLTEADNHHTAGLIGAGLVALIAVFDIAGKARAAFAGSSRRTGAPVTAK